MMHFSGFVKIFEEYRKFINSGIFFVIVGACAGIAHFLCFLLLLPHIEVSNIAIFNLELKKLAPEVSNFLAFLLAFSISFLGHKNFSFKDNTTPTSTSLYRFFTTAITGFVINEAVLIFLHRIIGTGPEIGVAVGMLLSAVTTFTLSRYWAFKKHDGISITGN